MTHAMDGAPWTTSYNEAIAQLDLPALLEAYKRDGYVIIPSLFTSSLASLRTLTSSHITQTRSDNWPHVRRVGKQFPPFAPTDVRDYWGIQHLMHPDLSQSEVYRSIYSCPLMLHIASALLECQATHLQMELFNLLINPIHHAFALGWHRDDIRADTERDEEQRRLNTNAMGIQWNIPLYDDDCLFVVPGTHTRVRTNEEIRANGMKPPPPQVDGKAEHFDGSWDIDPPNTFRVAVKAGDAVFYSQRILHRASYLAEKQRATLHGCYGQVSSSVGDTGGTAGERARMILQHDVDWIKEDNFGQSIEGTSLYPLWVNLMNEYEGKRKEDFGYSLDG